MLLGCATPPAATPEVVVTRTLEMRSVTLAMGYIPNVQFAPFYAALENGYFEDEGIIVTLDYGMENDLVELVASNELQFAIASGDQVLLGRAGGRPIRYVANWYRRYPVAISSIELDLNNPQALEGQTVGLPGLFGANYIGWLAYAQATGLDTSTIQLEAIGFNQVPILAEGRVDAAVVYAMNEPLQLEQAGYTVSTVRVADQIDLVANGLITNETTIAADPALVAGMVRAMVRGIEFTLATPDEAFAIAQLEKYGTGITEENAAAQRAVLEATLDYWRNSEQIGFVPESAWQTSQDFMIEAGLLTEPLPVNEVFTAEFLP